MIPVSPLVFLALGVLIVLLLALALCKAAAQGDRRLDDDHERQMRRRQERDAQLKLYMSERESIRTPLGSKLDPLAVVIDAFDRLANAAHERGDAALAERAYAVSEQLVAVQADGTLKFDPVPWWEDRANLLALLKWLDPEGFSPHAARGLLFTPQRYQARWDGMQAERLAKVDF